MGVPHLDDGAQAGEAAVIRVEDCPAIDVIVPTVDAVSWRHRCLVSLARNTNPAHLGRVVVVGPEPLDCGPAAGLFNGKLKRCETADRLPWKDAVPQGLVETDSPVVLHVQDDCLILPGNQDWLRTMLWPFTVDPTVGVVAATVSNVGNSNQSFKLSLPAPYYLTSSVVPVIFLARCEALKEATAAVTEDGFGDQEFPLALLLAGWKLVIATGVSHHHEGMQTNLRVYGTEYVETMKKRAKEELPKRFPKMWLARLDACEMVPFENHYVPRDGGVEVRLT